jgi:hypothetical protein
MQTAMSTRVLITGIAALFLATGTARAGDAELKQYQQQKKDYEQCVKIEGVNSPRCTELSDFDWDESELQRF